MITTEFSPELQEVYECKPRWEVILSDGRTVYQGWDVGESWKALRLHLMENPEITITKMFIGFRDNTFSLPENADGYFFRCGILSCWGQWEKHSFIVGTLEWDKEEITVHKYDLPEMIFMGTEQRSIEDSHESLIICKKNEKMLNLPK